MIIALKIFKRVHILNVDSWGKMAGNFILEGSCLCNVFEFLNCRVLELELHGRLHLDLLDYASFGICWGRQCLWLWACFYFKTLLRRVFNLEFLREGNFFVLWRQLKVLSGRLCFGCRGF